MDNYLFYLGLILMHEMDAIRCKEWRIFPLTSFLDDQWGFKVFMFAHIPLFLGLFYGWQTYSDTFKAGMNYFFIIHGFLHLLFLKHPKNEFKDFISWFIIGGCALSGFLSLVLNKL